MNVTTFKVNLHGQYLQEKLGEIELFVTGGGRGTNAEERVLGRWSISIQARCGPWGLFRVLSSVMCGIQRVLAMFLHYTINLNTNLI